MGLTSRLAAFAVDTEFADLPPDVVSVSTEMMLNAAGVGLAGSREDEGRILTAYVERSGASPRSTVLGAAFRSSPEGAALANGTMVHVLDFDENVERRANHPSNVLLPTVMAVGEDLGSTGQAVVAAFAIGCEISTKLGAIGDLDEQFPTMSSFGWQMMAVAGTFGAAAAAGRLLGLGQTEMENAFGLACSQAAGLQVNHGTSAKSIQAGWSAMRGIQCATLAGQGCTGARDGIEAENGFLAAYRRDATIDEDAFIARLGHPFDIIDPGVRLKIYPCGSLTHVSIEALLRLRDDHAFSAEEVRSVRVSVPARWDHSVYPVTHPQTGLEAKFSIAYCIAVTLVDGAPQARHFTDAAVHDPAVGRLLDLVTVVADELPTPTASRPSTVTVELADGRVLTHRAEFAKGHQNNPVTVRELDAKFLACSQDVLTAPVARELISGFRDLPIASDVRPLFSKLAGGG